MDNNTSNNTYNPENDTTMMWVDPSFVVRHGMGQKGGDDLWRTALGYIAWGDPRIKDTLLKHFVWDRYEEKIIKIYRSIDKDGEYGPRIQGYEWENTSRDPVVMTLAALKFRGDDEDCRKIARGLQWRISPRYSWTLDGWSWVKHLAGRWWFYQPWFMLLVNMLHGLQVIPNKFNFYHRSLRYYWEFVQHLQVWQHATSRQGWLNRIVGRFMLPFVEYRNILLRYLLNDPRLDQWEVSHAKPYKDYQWQRWFSNTHHKGEADERNPDKENLLDMDVLKAVIEKWPRQMKWDTMDRDVHASWWDRLTKGWESHDSY